MDVLETASEVDKHFKESEAKTRTNNIAIEVNSLLTQEDHINHCLRSSQTRGFSNPAS